MILPPFRGLALLFLHQASGIGSLLDPSGILHAAGPWAIGVVMLVIFIETGLLFPFLPGDSLLFTAALVLPALGFPLPVLILLAAVAAFAGDQVGYLIGRRFGTRLFKPDARIVKSKYRAQADAFFQRYGAASLVLARFVPIVRTYIPPIVGTSSLRYRVFLLWNALGGVAWATLLSLAGFFLGKIPVVANNVELIAVIIVVISVVPILIGVLRRRRHATVEPDRVAE